MKTLNRALAVAAMIFLGLNQVLGQTSRSINVKENRALVYHGKIVRPNGTSPTGSFPITLKIYSPEPSLCLLWQETQTVKFTNGAFSVELGHSANRIAGEAGGAALDFKQTFINNSSMVIGSAQCASGNSYTPSSADDRLLYVSITDRASVVQVPVIPIKSVPFALQAEEIGGYGLANLMKISGSGSSVTFSPEETKSLKDLLGNDLSWDMKSRKIQNLADPTLATDAATRGWVLSQITSSGGGTISSIGFAAPSIFSVSGSPLTADGNISMTLANQSANKVFAGPTSGGDTAPTFRSLEASDIPALDASKITTGTIAAARLPSGIAPIGAAGGDLSGTFPNPTVNRINGVLVSGSAPTSSSHILKYNGTTQYQPGFIHANDIRSTATGNAAFFPLTCTSSQTSVWNSLTDQMDCTNISVTAANVNFGSQTQNQFFAAPSGASGNPIFRAMVAADVPNLDWSKITSGKPTTISGFGITDNLIYNGGQAGTTTLGPSDANSLNLITSGSPRVTVTSGGNVGIGTTSPGAKLEVLGAVKIADGGETCTIAGNGGMLRYSGGNLQFCNGSAWQTLGVSGAGLTSLGGQTGSSQTFASGSIGTAPGISSGGNVHTLNVPMASGVGVTSGTISKTDYDFFTAKQPAGNYMTGITGDVVATGPGSVAATIQANAVTTSKIADGNVTTVKLNDKAVNFAKIQDIATNKLLGRSTASSGSVEELSLGAGLTLTAGTLNTLNNGTVTSVTSSNSFVTVTNGSTTPQITAVVGTAANTLAAGDDSRITGALQRAGGTLTGTLNMGGQDLTNAGNVSLAASKNLQLGTYATDPSTAGWTAADKGKTWFNTTSNQVKYWDGAAVQALGVSGAGLTSLGGQSGSTQTFATGATGTLPAIVSGGNVHTLNMPLASGAGVTSGTISKTEYDAFTAKLSSALTQNQVFIGNGSNIATAGWFGIGQLRNNLGAAQFPTSCTSAQTLTWSAVTDVLACTNIAISSAAVSGLGGLADNNSVDLSGAEATGTLAAGRFPALTGAITTTAGSLATSLAPNAVTTTSINNLAVTDAKINDVAWSKISSKPTTLSGYGITDALVVNGGQAGTVTVGSSNANALNLNTNGTVRMIVDSAGNVGIGTTTPNDKLNVAGRIRATHVCAPDGTNCKDLTSSWSGGSVTNIATGTGLTGGPITSTGTISLANIGANTLLANATGGAAAPTATSISGVIDSALSSTQGSILYRSAASWVALPPGTSGQVLKTQGAAANPSWSADANSGGTVTSVAGTAPISVSNGSSAAVVSMTQANSTTAGFLSSTDWALFNSKQDNTLASGQIRVGNGSNQATAVAISGDATINSSGALTIANSAVTEVKLANNSVSIGKISASGTASATTYLRGDGSWATPSGGGSGPLSWTVVTGNTSMNVNSYYLVNAASRISMSMPSTCAVGDVLKLVSVGSSGYQVSIPSGVFIQQGAVTVDSSSNYYVDSNGGTVDLVCTTANSTWTQQNAAGPAYVASKFGMALSRLATCVIQGTNRDLKCWGYNGYGTFGYGDTTNRCLTGGTSCIQQLPPVNFGAGRYPTKFVHSETQACAILDNGSMKCWGYNGNGALGYGDATQRCYSGGTTCVATLANLDLGAGRTAVDVTTEYQTTCVILDNGTLKCWGLNNYGQLGTGDTTNRCHTGGSTCISSLPAIDLGVGRTALKVQTSGIRTCAILDDGTVKCWGYNGHGQLGLGDTTTRCNTGGATCVSTLPNTYLPPGRTAKNLYMDYYATCLLMDNNQVICWGYNGYGGLGTGDTTYRCNTGGTGCSSSLPVQMNLGTGRSARKVVLGQHSTCVLMDNDQVKCFGYNGYGQIGVGSTSTICSTGGTSCVANLSFINFGSGRWVKDIAAPTDYNGNGSYHYCATLDNDQIKCWGRNDYGQLGTGDQTNRLDSGGSGAAAALGYLSLDSSSSTVALSVYGGGWQDTNGGSCGGLWGGATCNGSVVVCPRGNKQTTGVYSYSCGYSTCSTTWFMCVQ